MDHARGVNCLRLELLHDVQELIVHLWSVLELLFHLVQIRQCILNLELAIAGILVLRQRLLLLLLLQWRLRPSGLCILSSLLFRLLHGLLLR